MIVHAAPADDMQELQWPQFVDGDAGDQQRQHDRHDRQARTGHDLEVRTLERDRWPIPDGSPRRGDNCVCHGAESSASADGKPVLAPA